MRIALIRPEIAGNAGAVIRTASCFGVPVDIVRLGVHLEERGIKRASHGHESLTEVTYYDRLEDYRAARSGRFLLFTVKGDVRLDRFEFKADDILAFGSEGRGAPDWVHEQADARIRIPIRPEARSFNLSVSAALSVYEALRQTGGLSDAPRSRLETRSVP